MKISQIFLAALLPLVGLNTFAMEMYKAKVVSHKEWATNGAVVKFKSLNSHKQLSQPADNSEDYMYIDNRVFSYMSKVGMETPIHGHEQISVQNNSASPKIYQYGFSICAQVDDKISRCGIYQDQIEIQPGGYFTSEEEPELSITFTKPGVYKTQSEISLHRMDGTNTDPFLQEFMTSSGVIDVI